MAQDVPRDDTDPFTWQLGASCLLFDWKDRKWNDVGTIIGAFSDETGQRLKVQNHSEIKEILANDPDVRVVRHEDHGAHIVPQTIVMPKDIQSPSERQQNDTTKWKLGARCSLFNRQTRKWNEGTIVGSFSDENGEWIKVQCHSVIHDVLSDDPDLRAIDHDDAVISNQKINELQSMTLKKPEIAPMIKEAITISNKIGSALRGSSKS